ncbi:3-oxoacyl-[acyl-carrier-protein] reductase FabG-like [Oppia nitens]|uniref:3-oxoacyl-[acyl-carrier-protein] reductase FabG-like n=1 Tax=Oppia nitens TaxID=1686743 RepID=UPI0023DBEC20|nr:3-oxoacyl-[acyl-carrier-protein] reductase FabG-like [Oppia nitens]
MSLKYDFTGKVALITGSSSGIGAATAQLFAKSGANVVVTGRNADAVAKVAKQCSVVSPKQLPALEVVGDLTNDEDCNRLIETTVQTFGKIDILVNNAGAGIMAPIDATDYMEKFSLALKTNLNSVVYMTHKCVPYLAKTRGNIINISSIASKKSGSTGSSPYCMSKAGINMFTKCMAAELGPKRIRVNAILPGAVDTNFMTIFDLPKDLIGQIYSNIGQKYPVGRVGQSQDIAYTVAYLASDSEAGFITGSIVVADGGDIVANVSYE